MSEEVDADKERAKTCPVCGWGVVKTERVPENPEAGEPPNTGGTLYVHQIEATGNGRFKVEGCTEYENGETEAWEL